MHTRCGFGEWGGGEGGGSKNGKYWELQKRHCVIARNENRDQ